jgi:hypothetical protein
LSPSLQRNYRDFGREVLKRGYKGSIDWNKVSFPGIKKEVKRLAKTLDLKLNKNLTMKRYITKYDPVFTENYPFYDLRPTKIYQVPYKKVRLNKVSRATPGSGFSKVNKLPKVLKQSLLFPCHNECRFIGTWNLGVIKKKQKVLPPPVGTLKFFGDMDSILDESIVEKVRAMPMRFSVEGAWPTQQQEFLAYCRPSACDHGIEYYFDLIKDDLDGIKLPKIPDLPLDYLFKTGTNPDSTAGLLSSLLFPGKNTHKVKDRYIKEVSYDLLKRKIVKELTGDVSLWTVGGRTRSQKFVVGESLRSRLLIMPEGYSKIIKSWVVDTFYDESVRLNSYHPENEVQIGLNLRQGRFNSFFDRFTECFNVLEADMKRFDQHTNKSILTLAFCILRSCYPKTVKWDRIFFFCMSSDIHKNIVTPDGHVYKISRGIPTGSPFTTVIGCLVNWIAWTVCFRILGVSRRMYRLVCYGDDMLAGFPRPTNLDATSIEKVLLNSCGFEADPIRMHEMIGLDPYGSNPTLLKNYSMAGLPAKSFEDTLERVFFITSPVRSYVDHAQRITGSFYNAPFNLEGMNVVAKFREYLYSEMMRETNYHSDFLKRRFCGPLAFKISFRAGVNAYFSPFKSKSVMTGLPFLEKEDWVAPIIVKEGVSKGVKLLRDLLKLKAHRSNFKLKKNWYLSEIYEAISKKYYKLE